MTTCRPGSRGRGPIAGWAIGSDVFLVMTPQPTPRIDHHFASLTDRTITNLPYNAQGVLTQRNGFGTISGVAPPRTLQIVTRVTF